MNKEERKFRKKKAENKKEREGTKVNMKHLNELIECPIIFPNRTTQPIKSEPSFLNYISYNLNPTVTVEDHTYTYQKKN